MPRPEATNGRTLPAPRLGGDHDLQALALSHRFVSRQVQECVCLAPHVDEGSAQARSRFGYSPQHSRAQPELRRVVVTRDEQVNRATAAHNDAARLARRLVKEEFQVALAGHGRQPAPFSSCTAS
ncbi:hypothetical protein [Brevundimonas sp.]|uniref:hypothetical protein n=1 Tax=Brevundimonas sp. TaxID=1871086 RepID=UPI0035B1DEAB